jgi:RecJ-like exonuclease
MASTYQAIVTRFKEILVEHGQDTYLRRRCTSCSQTGSRAKFDKNCIVCSGTGFKTTLERYTMRKMVVGNQWSFAASLGVEGSGVILAEGTYFFAEANVNPKYGDLVYDFDNATHLWECFEVSKALERRWDNRVVFYSLACRLKEGSDN